jgi:hypothetical protein
VTGLGELLDKYVREKEISEDPKDFSLTKDKNIDESTVSSTKIS